MRCPMRLFVAFGFWLAFSGLALSQEVSHVPAGTSVKLPEFSVHPKWEQLFPPDHPFFVENYPDGTVQGMHARYLARLNGASATFHENGKLKSLAYYPDGVRQGGGYLWNEEQELAAYFHSKGGKVDGVVCLFKGNEPYLVQKWTDGALDKETLVSRKDGALVAVDGGDQLSPAHEALAGLMKEFTDSEKELNTHLRDSARAINEKIDEAKTHAARVTSAARMKADLARARHEADAATAAAHTGYRGRKDAAGRAASTDAGFSKQDANAATKKAQALASSERQKLNALASSLNGEAKELYVAALTALETALPSEAPDSSSAASLTANVAAVADRRKKDLCGALA